MLPYQQIVCGVRPARGEALVRCTTVPTGARSDGERGFHTHRHTPCGATPRGTRKRQRKRVPHLCPHPVEGPFHTLRAPLGAPCGGDDSRASKDRLERPYSEVVSLSVSTTRCEGSVGDARAEDAAHRGVVDKFAQPLFRRVVLVSR